MWSYQLPTIIPTCTITTLPQILISLWIFSKKKRKIISKWWWSLLMILKLTKKILTNKAFPYSIFHDQSIQMKNQSIMTRANNLNVLQRCCCWTKRVLKSFLYYLFNGSKSQTRSSCRPFFFSSKPMNWPLKKCP